MDSPKVKFANSIIELSPKTKSIGYNEIDKRKGIFDAENSTNEVSNQNLMNMNKKTCQRNSIINLSPKKEERTINRTSTFLKVLRVVCIFLVIFVIAFCLSPFISLKKFLAPTQFPEDLSNTYYSTSLINNCSIVNNITLPNITAASDADEIFVTNNTDVLNISLICPPTFTQNGQYCVPECGMWHPGGYAFKITSHVFTILGSSVSLLCAVLGIYTWIRVGKSLWEFPQVCPFYLLTCTALQAISILVGQISFKNFYCSSDSLIGARAVTTIQCQIQGAFFHYTSLVFIMWYLTYLFSILLIIAFPLKFRNIQKYELKIHITTFIICWTSPLLVLVAFWAIDSKRYEIVNFPSVCLPTKTLIFVTFVVPAAIMLILSLISVIVVSYNLIALQLRIRNHKIVVKGAQRKQNEFIARTLTISLVFASLILFLMLDFGVRTAFSGEFSTFVALHWACITRYGNSEECCPKTYITYYVPVLGILNDFFFSIWGVIGLSTVAVKGARKYWIRFFRIPIDFISSKSDFSSAKLIQVSNKVFRVDSNKPSNQINNSIDTEMNVPKPKRKFTMETFVPASNHIKGISENDENNPDLVKPIQYEEIPMSTSTLSEKLKLKHSQSLNVLQNFDTNLSSPINRLPKSISIANTLNENRDIQLSPIMKLDSLEQTNQLEDNNNNNFN